VSDSMYYNIKHNIMHISYCSRSWEGVDAGVQAAVFIRYGPYEIFLIFCILCHQVMLYPYFASTRSTLTLYAGAVYEKLLPVLICEVTGMTAWGVSGELFAVAEPESTVALPVP
jgi:hypothetical protein